MRPSAPVRGPRARPEAVGATSTPGLLARALPAPGKLSFSRKQGPRASPTFVGPGIGYSHYESRRTGEQHVAEHTASAELDRQGVAARFA